MSGQIILFFFKIRYKLVYYLLNITFISHSDLKVLPLCNSAYLSVLDLVFEGLLEEAEGVLLSVGLHHHVPGLLHLNLHKAIQESSCKHVYNYSIIWSVHPFIRSHLHLSVFLSHGLVVSLHVDHLLPQLLHLVGLLSVGPQQVLVVHQQAAHLKPTQGDIVN